MLQTTEQAYAQGRKDEREAVLKYLRDEVLNWRHAAVPDGKVVALALAAVLLDIEEWK